MMRLHLGENRMFLTNTRTKLIATCPSADTSQFKIATKRLKHLDKGLAAILDAVSTISSGDESLCLLKQYEEQLSGFKSELTL